MDPTSPSVCLILVYIYASSNQTLIVILPLEMLIISIVDKICTYIHTVQVNIHNLTIILSSHLEATEHLF